MDDMEKARLRFIGELWQRYTQVQQWAIENWPDREHPLTNADFVEARKEILGLRDPARAGGRDGSSSAQAEPADGGAQYEDVTPAPWP